MTLMIFLLESVHLLIDAKQDCSLRSFWNVDLNQALEERTKDVPFQGNQVICISFFRYFD